MSNKGMAYRHKLWRIGIRDLSKGANVQCACVRMLYPNKEWHNITFKEVLGAVDQL